MVSAKATDFKAKTEPFWEFNTGEKIGFRLAPSHKRLKTWTISSLLCLGQIILCHDFHHSAPLFVHWLWMEVKQSQLKWAEFILKWGEFDSDNILCNQWHSITCPIHECCSRSNASCFIFLAYDIMGKWWYGVEVEPSHQYSATWKTMFQTAIYSCTHR